MLMESACQAPAAAEVPALSAAPLSMLQWGGRRALAQFSAGHSDAVPRPPSWPSSWGSARLGPASASASDYDADHVQPALTKYRRLFPRRQNADQNGKTRLTSPSVYTCMRDNSAVELRLACRLFIGSWRIWLYFPGRSE